MSSPSDPAETRGAEAAPLDAADTDRLAGGSQSILRDRLVVALGSVVALAVAWSHRDQPLAAVALAGVVAVSTWLTVIDLREHRLPNRIVGPLALAVTLGLVVAGLVSEDLGRAGSAVVVGVIASLVFFVGNLFGGLGMGDVKYAYPAASLLAWYGRDPLVTAMLVMALSGAAVAVIVLARGRGRNHALPYGPFMAAGLAAGLLAAA